MTNQRHTISIHSTRRADLEVETLKLTFATRKAAMDAYRAMPAAVSADFPVRENHAVYSTGADAVQSVMGFFNIVDNS